MFTQGRPHNIWLFTILIYKCKQIQALQFFKDNKIMVCIIAVKILNSLENISFFGFHKEML